MNDAAGTLAPKVRLLLQMVQSANGQIDASDHQNSLLNYFCDDNGRETDTFNIAIKSGFIRVTHDSHFDTSTAYLTDVGREAALSTPNALDEAVIRKDEREKCAKIADAARDNSDKASNPYDGGSGSLGYEAACDDIASAIRSGGKP